MTVLERLQNLRKLLQKIALVFIVVTFPNRNQKPLAPKLQPFMTTWSNFPHPSKIKSSIVISNSCGFDTPQNELNEIVTDLLSASRQSGYLLLAGGPCGKQKVQQC